MADQKVSLGDEIKLLKNGDQVDLALGSCQQSNTFCVDGTSDGDVFDYRILLIMEKFRLRIVLRYPWVIRILLRK